MGTEAPALTDTGAEPRMAEPQEPRPRVTYHSPEGLGNGREVGAWAYGVACGLYTELRDDEDRQLIIVLKAEHLDGAACSIVAAGGSVARARETTYPYAHGEAAIVVSLGLSL
jgi:hypothetical protein